MSKRRMSQIKWGYRILHEDGSLEHEGLTSPFFHEAVVVIFGMAEMGENHWRYQVFNLQTREVWVSFKREALGISLDQEIPGLGFLSHFPNLPIIRGGGLPLIGGLGLF